MGSSKPLLCCNYAPKDVNAQEFGDGRDEAKDGKVKPLSIKKD